MVVGDLLKRFLSNDVTVIDFGDYILNDCIPTDQGPAATHVLRPT